MDFRQDLIKALVQASKLKKEEVEILLSVPPNPQMGDYAFPCFTLGKNAKEAAEKLKKKVNLPKSIAKSVVTGPYLNFYLDTKAVAESTLTQIKKEKKKYGTSSKGKGKTVVIDYSAPNIAKPFGIGHLRSTVIGNALYNVHKTLGYKVVGVNHLGDWGTQFGKLIVAYKKWGKEAELKKDPIKYLLKLYVKFHKEAETKESLIDEGREAFSKLEQGDKELLKLWERFRKLSLEEFERIYSVLNVTFDSYNGEAFYLSMLDKTITDLEAKMSTKMSDGALIVDLEKYKMPPVLLRKTNGATTYHTRDLAAVQYRLKKYKPHKILYVVGSEQNLHFKQLFKVLELSGEDKEKFQHVNFGLFRFPEGKMSTRKGKVIFLDEVLDKSINLALDTIKEKNPKLKNKKEVAKQVGVGAIIFGDLSNDRNRDVNFDWKRILSFEGETAPYVQYTHARSCSILRKAKEHKMSVTTKIPFDLLNLSEEQNLIKLLLAYPKIIEEVERTEKPHHLAQHLVKIAQSFNEFYHKCPVISEDARQMKARILLVDSSRQVIENGLGLLGIQAPEEM